MLCLQLKIWGISGKCDEGLNAFKKKKKKNWNQKFFRPPNKLKKGVCITTCCAFIKTSRAVIEMLSPRQKVALY